MLTPWLTDEEIDALCDGLSQSAAKIRFLKELGLAVREKPNGRPLVMRSNVEDVLGGLPAKRGSKAPPAAPVGPNVAGLSLAYSRARQ